MLINKPGAEFLYNGITYRVGDVIIGSDQSEYAPKVKEEIEKCFLEQGITEPTADDYLDYDQDYCLGIKRHRQTNGGKKRSAKRCRSIPCTSPMTGEACGH